MPQPRTIIWAIRHGQTTSNTTGRIQGHLATDLDALGVQQAQALRPVLQNLPWDIAVSSDLLRAAHTAQEAIDPNRIDALILDPALRERSLGAMEGQLREDLGPERLRAIHEVVEGFEEREGGESLTRFNARCVRVLEELEERWRGERVVVFTHGGVLRQWFKYVVGLPLDAPRTFSTVNASVSELHRHEGGWRVHTWGECRHLERLGFLHH